MECEVSNRRPSRLSPVFRRHTEAGARLRDWTRHVDTDWIWYCNHCNALVVLIEEKGPQPLQRGWGATRRLGTRHEDAPLVLSAEYLGEDTWKILGCRSSSTNGHESWPPQERTSDQLIDAIEQAFLHHYLEAGHPESLIPERLR